MRTLMQRLTDVLAPKGSKNDAKQRLKILLIHDQVDLPAARLEQMKAEILAVIERYCEIDQGEGVEFKLNREDGHISLISNVPVRRVTSGTARA